MRRWVLAALVLCGCPKRASPPVAPQTIRLLSETPEKETTQLTETRPDLEIDTRDFERTPRVVATGSTPLFPVEGIEARLFGDEAGTRGFSVDNVIFLEVLGVDGQVQRSVVVGFSDPVSQGKETVDNLGRQAFAFEPGEVNLGPILPERGSVRLRATVLDYSGVGKVSDVFVRLEAKANAGADDLRNH